MNKKYHPGQIFVAFQLHQLNKLLIQPSGDIGGTMRLIHPCNVKQWLKYIHSVLENIWI